MNYKGSMGKVCWRTRQKNVPVKKREERKPKNIVKYSFRRILEREFSVERGKPGSQSKADFKGEVEKKGGGKGAL